MSQIYGNIGNKLVFKAGNKETGRAVITEKRDNSFKPATRRGSGAGGKAGLAGRTKVRAGLTTGIAEAGEKKIEEKGHKINYQFSKFNFQLLIIAWDKIEGENETSYQEECQ